MKDAEKDILVHRFLNRETSEQENSEIFQWVSASEENRAKFRKEHQAFHLGRLNQFHSEIEVDTAWEKLNQQLPKGKRSKNTVQFDLFLKIAASVLIVVAVGLGSIWTSEHVFSRQKPALVQFEVPKGEKSKIVLADGSQVWLNSQTVLKYDAMAPRKVFVQGEAYFEVEKDRKNPFEITTISGMKVKVTGTRFNLRCYSGESEVETTLDEGKVIIENAQSKDLAELAPGQQAKYDIQSRQVDVKNVSTEIYSIWKNNELRLKDVRFSELIPKIERWYGVSIQLNSREEKEDRFTMTIKTESLRELLNMMQLTSKFTYKIEGEKIEIHVK